MSFRHRKRLNPVSNSPSAEELAMSEHRKKAVLNAKVLQGLFSKIDNDINRELSLRMRERKPPKVSENDLAREFNELEELWNSAKKIRSKDHPERKFLFDLKMEIAVKQVPKKEAERIFHVIQILKEREERRHA